MEEILARLAQVVVALAGAYVVALWFVLVVWAFRDIESRSRSIVTQVFSTLLVVLFFIPGILLYMILRPKQTLDESFQRSLEEEYLLQDLEELPLCPGCQRYVEDDFRVCPHCHTALREPCAGCARLVDLRWSLCPYCSAVQDGRTIEEQERVEAPAARWIAPLVRRRRAVEQPVIPAESVETPAIVADAPAAEPEVAATAITPFEPEPEAAPLTTVPDFRPPLRAVERRRGANGSAPSDDGPTYPVFPFGPIDRSSRSRSRTRTGNGHPPFSANGSGSANSLEQDRSSLESLGLAAPPPAEDQQPTSEEAPVFEARVEND